MQSTPSAAESVSTRKGVDVDTQKLNPAPSGWSAELNLSFDHTPDKTILRRSHNGPLMVQRPFYPEGCVCHTYILHPPGGIVGGDQLIINATVNDNASALIATPGATKYYGSNGRLATQHQKIKITSASLEWFPQEAIFFNNCHASQLLRVELNNNSRFIGWDISCFGRPSGNHTFEAGSVSTRLEVFVDNKPKLLERLKIKGAVDMKRATGLRQSSVSATMLAIAPTMDASEWLEIVRSELPASDFAATLIDGLLIVRYLGHSAEQARSGFISVWRVLRPVIMQKPFEPPRIWAT